MSILVTGSAGHLGEALVRRLRELGRPVIGMDVNASPFTDLVGSITDPDVVRRALENASAVLHAATLHKPHVATHSRQDFIDTNLTGTLRLLEASVRRQVDAFIFTSTTSTFGRALTPATPDAPAAWLTEATVPIPKNIYGATKVAAEDLCQLIHQDHRLPILVLRTSRFFPEQDDDAKQRVYADANLKTNELLHRRVDLEDVVAAHLGALDRARAIGFAKYIISAPTPFSPEDAAKLRADAPSVVRRLFPQYEAEYARRGWRMYPRIERVYDSRRAMQELGWKPRHDFASALAALIAGRTPGSDLARAVGSKGYHDVVFHGEDPYPTRGG